MRPAILIAFLFLGACSSEEHITHLECSNIKCDTLDTYKLDQFASDTTYHYDLTNADTVKLHKLEGDLSFSAFRCGGCKGVQYIWILDEKDQPLKEVMILHDGDAVSEKFNAEELFEGPDTYVKVNWNENGKIFYIER